MSKRQQASSTLFCERKRVLKNNLIWLPIPPCSPHLCKQTERFSVSLTTRLWCTFLELWLASVPSPSQDNTGLNFTSWNVAARKIVRSAWSMLHVANWVEINEPRRRMAAAGLAGPAPISRSLSVCPSVYLSPSTTGVARCKGRALSSLLLDTGYRKRKTKKKS